jgi:hypothetical protein
MTTTFTPKQPAEEYAVSFNFAADLGVETIVTAAITAVDQLDSSDVTGAILDVTKQANTTTIVYGWVRAGTSGHSYLLTCRIVGSAGSEYELDAILPVSELPGTASTQFATDLAVFFDTDDFAIAATLTHAGAGTSIIVIFDDAFKVFNAESGGFETSEPQALCKASDVSSAIHGDTLTINSIAYKIIGIQPSEDGLITTLVLSKD